MDKREREISRENERERDKDKEGNGFIFTWILHQIIMYSNKLKLVAG